MEDDHPPPTDLSYFPHHWSNTPVDENHPIEQLDHSGFTNSQTQILESIIANEQLNEQLLANDAGSISNEYPIHFVETNPDSLFTTIDFPIHYSQQVSSFHPSPTSSSYNGVPSLESWSGDLNYHAEFNKAQDRTKSTSWIFSAKLEKLFVQLDKACPVNFKLNIPPILFPNYQVRAQIVYSKAEDFHDSVERCINHQQKDTVNLPHTAHVLRCDDASSSYVDHENNRHSVVVGLQQPAPGSQHVTLCFRFMCLSSCIGSLNRRQTKIIFSLENLSGSEVGRYATDVRICSCPGRDIKTEEEKFAVEGGNDSNSDLIAIHMPMFKSKTKKRKQPALINPNPSLAGEDDNDKIYNLNRNIRGKANYEMVKDVVDRMLARINAPRNEIPSPDSQSKRFKEELP